MISDTLVISPCTARAHIRRIYSKLDVHSHQELIGMAETYVVSGAAIRVRRSRIRPRSRESAIEPQMEDFSTILATVRR